MMERKEDRTNKKKILEKADWKMASATEECKKFLDMVILKTYFQDTVIATF